MPVDQKHPDYPTATTRWARARDVVDGEDKVKAKGETYLPKLSGQDDKEFQRYLSRANLFNGTGRTLDGLSGLAFRKPPVVAVPSAMKGWLDDIDLAGTPLVDFIKGAFDDELMTCHGGILAEYPKAEVRERTAEEIAALGLRPYLTFWPAESIWDWREGRIGNRTTTVFLKLYAITFEPDPSDPWAQVKVEWLRIFRLTAEEGVTCEIQTKAEKAVNGHTTAWAPRGDKFPIVIGGKTATEIPFVFLGDGKIKKGALDDLVCVNLAHYRNSADYENGLHRTGVPTPVFIGDFVSESGEDVTEVHLGSDEGIHLGAGGDSKFLEYTGQGLSENRAAMVAKENQMAILGARILASDTKGVEAAETAEIHRAGESSVLASIASSVARAMKKALEFARDFASISGDISVQLNTEYLPAQVSPQEIAELLKAVQSGDLPRVAFLDRLKVGGLLPDDADTEAMDKDLGDNSSGTLGSGLEFLKAQNALLEAQRGKSEQFPPAGGKA